MKEGSPRTDSVSAPQDEARRLETRAQATPVTITDPGGSAGPTAVMTGQLQSRMGRYLLRGELGRGGMGVVFLAWDPLLKRDVALKVLKDAFLAEDAVRARMLREATAVARVRHPGIVEVYDFGEDQGHLFFTMRLVNGLSLAQRLREGRLEPHEAARVAAQVARALQHAHDHGLIHRDVKPGNILLDAAGEAVLMDFGLVKEADSGEISLTRDTQVLGTPAYMAPEQISEGARHASPLSDQYALGVVLYQMLKGWPPYYGATPMEIWRRILREDPPPFQPEEVPPDLVAITMKAMARDPADRYPSAAALAEDLQRFLSGERVLAARPGAWLRAKSLLRRRPASLTLPALVLVALALAFVGRWAWERAWGWREARVREQEADERLMALSPRLAELEAAGEREEVDQLFGIYADFEGNAETSALARAWLDQATRLEGRGESGGATEARATAYALATSPDLQQEALLGLARVYRARQDWSRLRDVLLTLEGSAPTLAQSPEATRWRRDIALRERDLSRAVALSADAEERALLQALSSVTRTGRQALGGTVVDLDADGREELMLLDPEGVTLSLVEASRGLPARARIPTPGRLTPYRPAFPLGPGRSGPLLVQDADGRCTIQDLQDGAMVERGEITCRLVRDALNVDLDEDGAPEIYLADDRRLARLRLEDGPPRLEEAHLATSASNSEIWSLVAGDLDGDGHRELAVGTSGWGAYDVRILAAKPEGLRLRARLQLGRVTALRALRTASGERLAAFQVQDPYERHNVQIFGPDLPQGAPLGLHLLSWRGGALESAQVTPLEHIAHAVADPPVVGDLDGDGDDDLVAFTPRFESVLLLARADGSFQPLVLGQLAPVAALNLDADPADELVLSGPELDVFVLGDGSDSLPSAALTAPLSRAPTPPEIPASMVPSWERAEQIVALGLPEVAIERLQRLAGLDPRGAVELAAHQRMARLYELAGRPGQAGALYVRVAEASDQTAAALEDAFRCFLQDRRFDEALAAARARASLPNPPIAMLQRMARLERELAVPAEEIALRDQLDPRVEIRAPQGLLWSTSAGGLHVRAAGEAELLRLRVEPTGGPVSVQIELAVQRLDYAAWLELRRAPAARPQDRSTLMSLNAGGGGGVIQRWLYCQGLIHDRRDVTGLVPDGARFTLSYESGGEGEGGSCTTTYDGQERQRNAAATGQLSWEGSPEGWWISLWSRTELTGMELTLTGIRVEGARVIPPPEDPLSLARRRITLGDPEGALRALQGARVWGREVEMIRAMAADGLGRDALADEALRQALADDLQGRRDAARLLLIDPERMGPRLRRVLGSRYYHWVADQLYVWFNVHREDERVRALLSTQLEGLEQVSLSPRAPLDQILAQLTLLTARGHAWIALGRTSLASQDLLAAIELGERQDRARLAPGEDAILLLRQLAAAWQGLARLRYESGDEQGALEALERGLAVHPSPQVFAELLSAWPPLAGLHIRPGWRVIDEARVRPEI